jgi:hypothetical protein
MKKGCVLVLLCSVLLLLSSGSAFAQAFGPNQEPDGFRDLEWGTDAEAIKGLKFLYDGEMGGSLPADVADCVKGIPMVRLYQRSGDKLQFGKVKLHGIAYGFCDGKLCEVKLVSRGEKNRKPFMKEVFKRFGEGKRINLPAIPCCGREAVEFYSWMGNVSEMELVSRLSPGNYVVNQLWIGSKVVRDQVFDQERQRKKDRKETPDE